MVEGTLIEISRLARIREGILHSKAWRQSDLAHRVGRRTGGWFPASVRLGVAFEGNDTATEEQVIQFLTGEGVEA